MRIEKQLKERGDERWRKLLCHTALIRSKMDTNQANSCPSVAVIQVALQKDWVT